LRYNKKQLLIDRAVTLSMIFGWVTMRWTGVVAATNVAILMGTVYNAFFFDRMRKHSVLNDQMEKPDPNYKPKKL